MPAKTDVKKKVLILGTGPDAEEARQIADDHADVTVSSRFTANVTHLVVDETVKQSEQRLKRASSESVPVLRLAAFKELLGVTGTEDKGTDAAEDTSVPQQAEAPAVEQDSEVAESAADESTADESAADQSTAEENAADENAVEESTADESAADASDVKDDAPAAEEATTDKVEDSNDTASGDKSEEKADSTKSEPKKEKKPAKSGDDASAKAVDESKPVDNSATTTASPKVGFVAKLKALFVKK